MKTRSHPATPSVLREPAASAASRHGASAHAPLLVAAEGQIQRRQLTALIDPKVAQHKVADDKGLLQGRFAAVPAETQVDDVEDLVDARASNTADASTATAELVTPNRTGMPDALKSGIESLSGRSMDDVRVHYNSSQPAQLNALAYAQGSAIHLAPGQEEHLPHEAWHVVQQAQGRVQPTMQLKDGVPVNDDLRLENEANVMGGRAIRGRSRTEGMAASAIEPLGAKQDGKQQTGPATWDGFATSPRMIAQRLQICAAFGASGSVAQRMAPPAPTRANKQLHFSPGPYNPATELPAWLKHGHTAGDIEEAVAAGWEAAVQNADEKVHIEWGGDPSGVILVPFKGGWKVMHAYSGIKKEANAAAAPAPERNWGKWGKSRKGTSPGE